MNVPDASCPVLGTPKDANGSGATSSSLPSTAHHVDSSKMGYRQAAVLTSVSFFLGMCSAACRRPLSLTCSYLPCLCVFLRGSLYLLERRLPDPVHAAHGVCRPRWTGVLHHVLQLPARYQGECPCFTSGVCPAHSRSVRPPVYSARAHANQCFGHAGVVALYSGRGTPRPPGQAAQVGR